MKKSLFVLFLLILFAQKTFSQYVIAIDSVCMTKNKQELGEMLKDAESKIQKGKNNVEEFFNRGVIEMYLGDSIAALSDFNKCITLEKKYGDAYTERARLKTG
ncbi:MAG: hypothetical protein IAF38_02500 [Bacteroidia bacterium]|nr:hypothetical protein [Bacteroidia bacterium]